MVTSGVAKRINYRIGGRLLKVPSTFLGMSGNFFHTTF